jgi:TolB-like protein/cytochrome c-type biogenesis protein CcmH/NrfG
VLPFVNMSDDASNEFFSDGISEEMLNLLAKIPELRVTSRSSAFSFKGKNVKIADVARDLNVAHVLEGSVRKAGNQVRITAQLIEVDGDTHLWSGTYDRTLEDIFAIQDEIASEVVAQLKVTLLGVVPVVRETNPEAYALYLQGRYFINKGTEGSHEQAEILLKQALAIDPGFAAVWTELASVYMFQAGYNFRPHDEGSELARNAAQQALAIDSEYARGYAALAVVEMQYDWNFVAAYQHSQQALALDSGDTIILQQAANLETRLGRFDEAIDLYRESIVLDPVFYDLHLGLGRVLYYAHRLDEAAASLREALLLAPGIIRGQYFLGWVLLAQGDAKGALVAMEQENGDYYRLTGITVVQHALHNAGESDAALKELIENRELESHYQIALAYAYRGDINTSFEWLQRAYDIRDSGLNKMLVDPLLANLHDDPRWMTFLDKMGLHH